MAANTSVTPGKWIRMGWSIVREDIGNFILISLVAAALTAVGSFVVAGPLLAGMFIAVRRRMLEGRTDFMDLFAGFNSFVDSFLTFILVSVFMLIGLMLCIFPVIIVAALYLFPFLFLIDRKLSFWDAMESSRKLAARDLTGYVVFVLLLLLLNFVGLLLLGLGLLVTVPVSVAALAVAYKESVGFLFQPPASHGPVVIP